MALMSPIQGISLLLYDMKESEPTVNLAELIVKWTQRKVGILHDCKHRNGDSFEFTVATKIDANEPFSASTKTAEYPDSEDCKSIRKMWLQHDNETYRKMFISTLIDSCGTST